MTDKRKQPRPCQGVKGTNPTLYKLGNTLARKTARSARRDLHPVAAAFKAARLASGLSQEVVAERAGYDMETVSRFERGQQSVRVATLFDLCLIVGLELTVQPARAA